MHLQLLAVFFGLTFLRLIFKKAKEYTLIGGIPSPSGFPLIGQAFQFKNNSDHVQKLVKWAEQFGSRYRIQIGVKSQIILSSAKDAQLILATHTDVDKGKDYEYFWPWIGITLLTSAGKKWENKRSMMEPAFHPKYVEENNYLEVMNERVDKLLRILSKKTEPIIMDANSDNEIFAAILKILMEITTGQQISRPKRADYEKANIRLKMLVNHRRFRPWLYPSILWRLSPSGREESRCLKVIQDVIDNAVQKKKDERKKSNSNQRKRKKHDDFVPQITEKKNRRGVLDHLLEWQEKAKAPNTVSDYDIRDEINSLVFAGYEPTALCIMRTLSLIGSNVSAQEQLQNELDEILNAKKSFINLRDLGGMDYLEMCIKETLRLFPSVPTIGRDVYSDFKLDDQTVLPAGVSVTLLLDKIQRDPSIFQEPNRFKPERFSKENVQSIDLNSFLVFSNGRRGCLGQNLAMTMIKLILARILMKFDIKTRSASDSSSSSSQLLIKTSVMIELIPRRK